MVTSHTQYGGMVYKRSRKYEVEQHNHEWQVSPFWSTKKFQDITNIKSALKFFSKSTMLGKILKTYL